MASHMDPAQLETFLVHILTPVYRIAEDDTIRDSQIGEFDRKAMMSVLTFLSKAN